MVAAAESGAFAPRTRTRRADHAGFPYDADIDACESIMTAGGPLHYVALITSGIWNFATETPDVWQGYDAEYNLDQAGRQLSHSVAQLDNACEPLDTGPLIRVVLQGNTGALFYYLKITGQSFFGITLDGTQNAIEQADRQMTKLTELAARRVGSISLNWGGFEARAESGELWKIYDTGVSDHGPASQMITQSGQLASHSVAQLCCAALNPEYLHYVGIYRCGQPVWCADNFDDPALAPFFMRVSAKERRERYMALIQQIQLQSRRFASLLDLVHSDNLTRLILDVARGAIYVTALTEDDYLVGVTLIQPEVERADKRMRALFTDIRQRERCD